MNRIGFWEQFEHLGDDEERIVAYYFKISK